MQYDRKYKEEALKLVEEKGCKKASEELGMLITGAELISFPGSVKILPQLALCYQVLSDIMDHIEDNNMPHDQLDKVVEALDNASFSMSCICNKIDALLPDDEEVTDDGN